METCLLTVLLNNGVLEIGVARLDVEVDISSLRLLLPLILKGQVTAIVGKHLCQACRKSLCSKGTPISGWKCLFTQYWGNNNTVCC